MTSRIACGLKRSRSRAFPREFRYAPTRGQRLVFVLSAPSRDDVTDRSLIVTQLARETNLVTLYKVLGGGWKAGP